MLSYFKKIGLYLQTCKTFQALGTDCWILISWHHFDAALMKTKKPDSGTWISAGAWIWRARELTGSEVVSFGRVWNRILLLYNWSYAAKRELSVVSEQPTLVWTNSAQMMQPYLPLAVALTGLSFPFTAEDPGSGCQSGRLRSQRTQVQSQLFTIVFLPWV